MRVTNKMISDRVIFNLQRSLGRFMTTQMNASTGRRINRASDDPIGTVRDLKFRTELSKISQYQKNIGRALSIASTYDNTFSDIGAALSTVNEIVVAMADGVFDAEQRKASATELEAIIDQILLLANGRIEGKQLFGGYKVKTTSFERGANGVVYRGDQGQTQFEIDSGSRTNVNMIGSDVFMPSFSILGEKADLNVSVLGTTPLSELKNGLGIDQTPGTFTITDKVNGVTSTVDISGATTLDDVLVAINNQLAADGITTLTAKLGLENNNILLDTTNDGKIALTTNLFALNNGDGIDLSPGTMQITDGGGINFAVDISSATTIGDVITAMNTQITAAGLANVTVAINAAGDGLSITDTNVPPLGLTIADISASSPTASQLGITGQVGSLLEGSQLDPELRFDIAETTGSTAADLGILKEISADYSGEDLDPVLTLTSIVSDFNLGAGLSPGEIKISQGDRVITLNLGNSTIVTVQDMIDAINNAGLNITASINADKRGIQIVNNDIARSLTIEDVGNGRTTKDFDIFGSGDLFGSLQVILNALKRDSQEELGLMKQNIEDSISHILDQRAISGSRAKQLETVQIRLDNSTLRFTKLLSEIEDADLTEVLTRLASEENSYQSALIASSKIIQPSLLDFLRR